MSEYLFSRVIPRADLGWSQVERFARLDSYGQHQTVWQLFDLPPATVKTDPAFLAFPIRDFSEHACIVPADTP